MVKNYYYTTFEDDIYPCLLALDKVFEENNKIANCGCTPHLYIYDYDNIDVSLNRDYDELNEESD